MSAVSFASRLLALCVSVVWAGASFAADAYPDHPVKIIAPFAAGGPSDFVARLLADKLSQSLGQQFYVEDHAGAGGNIGMTQVARSAPDGYTILVASSSYRGQSEPLRPQSLRSVQGFRADHAGRRIGQHSARASLGSGQDGQGTDRADAGQSRQICHRQCRSRHHAGACRRIVQARLQARPAERAL